MYRYDNRLCSVWMDHRLGDIGIIIPPHGHPGRLCTSKPHLFILHSFYIQYSTFILRLLYSILVRSGLVCSMYEFVLSVVYVGITNKVCNSNSPIHLPQSLHTWPCNSCQRCMGTIPLRSLTLLQTWNGFIWEVLFCHWATSGDKTSG